MSVPWVSELSQLEIYIKKLPNRNLEGQSGKQKVESRACQADNIIFNNDFYAWTKLLHSWIYVNGHFCLSLVIILYFLAQSSVPFQYCCYIQNIWISMSSHEQTQTNIFIFVMFGDFPIFILINFNTSLHLKHICLLFSWENENSSTCTCGKTLTCIFLTFFYHPCFP